MPLDHACVGTTGARGIALETQLLIHCIRLVVYNKGALCRLYMEFFERELQKLNFYQK